ncbi:E3 ubiquitin-protein ligase TRIM56-like [Patiria miniata]|uniref:Uncharacterized protein n=1 Tax=Patiria miniata TaxID=46514 RepID=A0A913ZL34_PATMI|nr:E3 ubiquitin-protein ligase TRIM56-like [Patiria miniata]XP_038052632.1 E3 ubiquitin-protein ligase TRIM56-like [Patiria miniata]
MVEAAATSVLGTISRGHLECPICCCRFTDPKILDCLHSFCLNCLKEFTSRQLPKAHEITCPVCRRVTAVPDTRLQGLPNCFFLSALVDEFNKQERLLGDAPADIRTCEECDEGLEAVSRCLDCCKIICTKCLEAHERMKSTRHHRIVRKEQNRFDVTPIEPRKKDTPQCNQHTNQDLCFYCETCQALACGKCAELDHRTAEHEYREVADAIQSYRQDVGEILQRFEQSREEFKVADDSLTHAKNRVRIMVARACKDIAAKEEEEIAKIRNKSRLLRNKVTLIGETRVRKFEEVQKSSRDKMERAEQIVATVNDLMQQADDFELLNLKPKVMNNLEFQDELEFEQAQHELSFIGVKCQDVVADTDLGEVLQEEKWQLKVEFGDTGPEDGKLEFAAGVACLSNGDIAVTDLWKQQLMVFTSTGEYKESIGGELLNDPGLVAVTVGGLLLVEDEKYVKVLDSGLLYISQFEALPDDAVDEDGYTGIAVDKENRIAVADPVRKMISLHRLDGSLIRTIPNDMVSGGLAIGIRERLIFTNVFESKLICITYTGDEVFSVDTSLDGEPVRPGQVCCDDAGDIYVAVGSGGFDSCEVHHYSPAGVFIGRVARGLHNPFSLTFTQSGDLVVADRNSVKIFQRV